MPWSYYRKGLKVQPSAKEPSQQAPLPPRIGSEISYDFEVHFHNLLHILYGEQRPFLIPSSPGLYVAEQSLVQYLLSLFV